MKKSLSAILSLAMAFSMFSSVALGADAKKSSADFTDLKDLDAATKAKFDEMIGAGIFEGDSTNGTFGVKNKMTRAQFAKVAALIFNLKVDTSLKTSSFSDVKNDDPANGWAIPYIEAAKAAGITDGYGPGTFNPGGDVTKQELATFLIRGLGKDSEGKNKTGVSDKTVTEWARGYVALALELKLLSNGADGTFGGTSAATRDLLVTSSYEAKKLFVDNNKPAKASVKEVKAVDYNKVQVTLDRDVDTDKATFVLKKGTTETKYEAKDKDVKWSDDKKVATLTLKDGAKIVADTYSVTIGGLDASAVDKVSGEFKGEVERLEKIDFVTANETVARSKKVRIQFKPTNQYGQLASFTAGSYNVNVPYADAAATVKRSTDGKKMYVELNTDLPNVYPGSTTFSVNVWSTEFRDKTAQKVFKIGEYPTISKIELGDIKYSNDKSAIHTSGDEAVVQMTQYDQYGGEITVDSGGEKYKINDSKPQILPKTGFFEDALDAKIEDKDGDSVKEVIVFVKSDKKITASGEFALTVWGNGSTATADIKVSASKVATKVEFGSFSKNTIAIGDKDFYLEVNAYDAAGTKLTPDEIVDNVKDKRFNFQVNGPIEFGATADVPESMLDANKQIVTTGEHKGKLHFAKVTGKSNGSVWVYIQNMAGADSNKSIPYTTNDARYPVLVREVIAGANKAVAGAEVKPKYELVDNYQEVIKENLPSFTDSNGKTVTYDVYATVTNSGASFDLKVDDKKLNPNMTIENLKEFSGKEVTLKALDNSATGSYEVKFAVRKKVNGEVTDSNVSAQTKRVTVIDATKEDLKYSLAPIKDLFKTIDDGTFKADGDSPEKIANSKLAKEVKVEARDTSGNLVAYPKRIVEVVTDNYTVLRSTETTPIKGEGYIIGNKTGTANVTARFYDAKNDVASVTGPVTVKGEAIKVESLERKDSSKNYQLVGASKTVSAWELMGDITVKDNYGDEFKNERIKDYDRFTGVRYTITDASKVGGNAIAKIDPTDHSKIIITGTGTFTITASTSGKSVATTVNVKN